MTKLGLDVLSPLYLRGRGTVMHASPISLVGGYANSLIEGNPNMADARPHAASTKGMLFTYRVE